MQLLIPSALLLGLLRGASAFVPMPPPAASSAASSSSSSSPPRLVRKESASIALFAAAAGDSSDQQQQQKQSKSESVASSDDECDFRRWASDHGMFLSPKVSVRPPHPDERGKGGVSAAESVAALEVLARVPRSMVLSAVDAPSRAMEAAGGADAFSWASDLTAAALTALHPSDDELSASSSSDDDDDLEAKREWISSWIDGGWATSSSDLGPPETDWGPKCVTGTLMATGSDNDHNVYAKFRFPCHPTVHRAGLGLALLTGCDDGDALDALVNRGRVYRSMRDALSTLVTEPSEGRRGSLRERRAWDVADCLSRVSSRVTPVQFPERTAEGGGESSSSFAVVPLHERLGHCADDRGENTRLVASDEGDGDGNGEVLLLLAARDIEAGEELTRDYRNAPRLDGDESRGALRLLLQFGLPPKAWEVA